MATVVQLHNASKRFGTREVLAGVSGEVHSGEVVGVVGPNGAGKSTLLLLMAGLLRATSGTVTVCGLPADRVALDSAGLVGLVLAQPGMYPLLTGWENLHYFGGLFGLPREQVVQRAAPLLERFALTSNDLDARLATWSTGMQQKLSLVRALLLDPRLLLFDEPAANLDPLAARVLYQELRQRADDGLACVLVTHDLVAAEAICDRVWIVKHRIVEELRPDHPGHELPAGPLLEAWRRMEGS